MASTSVPPWAWAWLLAWTVLLTVTHGLSVGTGTPETVQTTPQRNSRFIGGGTYVYSQPLRVKTKAKNDALPLKVSPGPASGAKYIPRPQEPNGATQYILPSQKAFNKGEIGSQYITTSLKVTQGANSGTQYIPVSQGFNSDPQYVPLSHKASQGIETKSQHIALSQEAEGGPGSVPRSSQPQNGSPEIGVSPNIKFYSLSCTSGKPCSTIIPAPTPSRSSRLSGTKSPFSEEQVRRYLQQFSLRNGFQYSKDFEDSGRPKELSDSAERSRLLRDPKMVLLDYSGKQNEQEQESWWSDPASQPGRVYKHQQYRPKVYDWASVQASFPSRWSATATHQGLPGSGVSHHDRHEDHHASFPPRPSSILLQQPSKIYDPGHSSYDHGHSRYPSKSPQSGTWRRYSSSTITQLDKDTGEWVKVSSSGPHHNGEVLKSSPTQKKQVQLTVLGVSDDLDASDGGDRGMHVVMKPSSLPGMPPAFIETDGGDDGDDNGGDVNGGSAGVQVRRKPNQRQGRRFRAV
ncbi:uncharacterized protein LOC127008779 isoform X2 [Eriocheir sinensis]|uniref:uncharacterized protein LOC127008779 isoform X2 n=1 Tax=Eriocheir sinensis TaxID=95602 RepID=UPI0021C87710|nr:uncharacterized protein LOC127008779 isoform X2 [Eriocheir sinensis]